MPHRLRPSSIQGSLVLVWLLKIYSNIFPKIAVFILYIYIVYDEVRLDPHQDSPLPISYFPSYPTSPHQISPLLAPSCLAFSWRLDAQVWASMLKSELGWPLGLLREKAAAAQQKLNHLHMYVTMKQLAKCYEGMLHQHSPLKFPIGDFTPYRS